MIKAEEYKVELTCEICGQKYIDLFDRKKITATNTIAVLFYCCSLECERESWQRIDENGKRI